MSTAVESGQERKVVEGVHKQLYIDGEWRDGSEGGVLEVEDPATGEALCEVADGTPDDAVAALAGSAARTGIRHVLLMVEGAGDRSRTCENIARLGAEVLPRLLRS